MRLALCIWLVVAYGFTGVANGQDGHVAMFKNASGNVKIVRNGSALEASPGMTLVKSDRIVTGADSAGGIVFKDGTTVTVGASTEVEIRDFVFAPNDAKYAFSVYLAKGTAIYSSGKIGKLAPESVKVDTPMATVAVRGTRFIVQAD